MVQLPRVTQPARNRARTQTWVCLAAKPPLSALPEAAEVSHGAWAGRTPLHFPPSKRAGTWIRLLGKTLYTWMEKKGTGDSWVPPSPPLCWSLLGEGLRVSAPELEPLTPPALTWSEGGLPTPHCTSVPFSTTATPEASSGH